MKADPEEALSILLANQNEENFPLSETVERKSMATLLPMMETDEVPFFTQSDECWRKILIGCLIKGSSKASLR